MRKKQIKWNSSKQKTAESKNTMKKVKSSQNGRKYLPTFFANEIPDMGLVSRMYKELLQLNKKKAKDTVKKQARTWTDE